MTVETERESQPSREQVPRLETFGHDLTVTTRGHRRLALARPFAVVLLFALAWYAGWWWLTPFAVFLVFVAVVAVTHDVVHNTLGLSRRQTEWALFVTGALLLESGHAYRTTHLRHHAVFPGPDDPEGDPAGMSFWRSVLHGPVFLPKLWWWAWRRQRGNRGQRTWLLVEALFAIGFAALATSANPYAPRQGHSRPVPRAYVSPGTSPVPAGAEPSLGRAVQAFDAIL
jgi:fatty acid desaturase